jgi:UDP-N-acetyl-2-amino-2-deoxyglucuronate dehydrogenase
MKNFVLIGAGGYIAPRHMKAIKDTGNNLLAAVDKHDSVGVLDSYFPDSNFFTEFERFDRHCEKLKRSGQKIDYVVVCSPNYLHDAHIRFGLRIGADVICEKPVVLNPWNIEALMEIEKETHHTVNTILQLRLHPAIIELKNRVGNEFSGEKTEVDLSYITSRGKWYHASWKGDIQKSGGIATNIGVHFFDMLLWVFGKVLSNKVTLHTDDTAAGVLELERANIKWLLSINEANLPEEAKTSGKKTFRSMKINNEAFEFSDGFTELHTNSYKRILGGEGFGIQECLPAIELVHQIRTAK